LLLLMLVLIVGPPSGHIWWHALPCRQMTIHPAGLVKSVGAVQSASWIGEQAPARCRTVVGGAGWLLGIEIVSASKIEAENFYEEKVEGIAGCGRRFGVVA
jgi:hypothetical protein